MFAQGDGCRGNEAEQADNLAGKELVQPAQNMPQPLFADENAVPEYLTRLTHLQVMLPPACPVCWIHIPLPSQPLDAG